MGRKRTINSGRVDSLDRPIMVSGKQGYGADLKASELSYRGRVSPRLV